MYKTFYIIYVRWELVEIVEKDRISEITLNNLVHFPRQTVATDAPQHSWSPQCCHPHYIPHTLSQTLFLVTFFSICAWH